MRIYTRKGDHGETDLRGGLRVRKDHIRVDTYGTVDELNAHLGLLRLKVEDDAVSTILGGVQSLLFEAGAELATAADYEPAKSALTDKDVLSIEEAIDQLESTTPPLTNFVLPGGTETACRAHIARCVCRRAERSLVRLMQDEQIDVVILRYLNRLSDFLFVLARWANHAAGVPETKWSSRLTKDSNETGGPG